jgi:glycosyltransferase involved in cell wall biosynthesis
MPDFLVLAAILPRIFGKKLILDIHDSMPETFQDKFSTLPPVFYKLLCFEESISCHLAHRVICVNHVQRDILVKRGLRLTKITTLLNVPDHNIFKQPIKISSRNPINNDFRLVYHGTVDKLLGIDFAIKVVAALIPLLPGIELHIFPRESQVSQFINLTKDLGIQDRVYFRRKTYPPEDLPSLLARMHLGIIANRQNPTTDLMLPTKMLEYVALGIPIVAPRLRAIQYYFRDDMISYYEPENPSSMAEAIFNMYKSKQKRQKQAERAMTFLHEYSWSKHQHVLLNLYNEIL